MASQAELIEVICKICNSAKFTMVDGIKADISQGNILWEPKAFEHLPVSRIVTILNTLLGWDKEIETSFEPLKPLQ